MTQGVTLTTSINQEPNTFQEAMGRLSPDREKWLRACQEEVQGLEKQHTYD